MKKYRFLIALIILNVGVAYSQEIRPLYQLPSKINTQVESESDENIFLVGSDSGLFKITSNNNVIPLWTECRVDQLSHVRLPDEKGVFRGRKRCSFAVFRRT